MKKLVALTLTSLSCIVLSACSGGGSKGASSTPSSTPAATTTQTVAPTTTTTATTTQSNVSSTGGVYVISDVDDKLLVSKKTLTTSDSFKNKIVVDGKDVTIGFPNILSGGWANIGSVTTCCGKYNDVRFGAVNDNGPSENAYLFYNGNVTKTMPTSGVANYNGEFLLSFDGDVHQDLERRLDAANIDDDYLTGNATFRADFGSKKLSGSLNQEYIQPIKVQATIKDNSFTGSASSPTLKGRAELEGKFFGTNAKELGGIFKNQTNDWGGAFGAAQ